MTETLYVSVVISMYNVEKYVAEMLDSLLAQTLKNFEVIVINNGCTDGSAAVAEKYLPKFDGRMRLLHTKVNPGSPSPARNKGCLLARGKYVFFMDSDDILLPTALEEMVTAAEMFQSEALYCNHIYLSSGTGKEFLEKAHLSSEADIEQPAFFTESLDQKMQDWIVQKVTVPPWRYFVRRDFLIENNIDFPLIVQEDSIWAFKVFLLARKFLLIPNACYIHRIHEGSLSDFTREHFADSMEESIKNFRRKLDRTICELENLDKFLCKAELFINRPDLRQLAVMNFMLIDINWIIYDCTKLKLSGHQIYEIIKTEFKDDMGDKGILISHFCTLAIKLMYDVKILKESIANSTPPPVVER